MQQYCGYGRAVNTSNFTEQAIFNIFAQKLRKMINWVGSFQGRTPKTPINVLLQKTEDCRPYNLIPSLAYAQFMDTDQFLDRTEEYLFRLHMSVCFDHRAYFFCGQDNLLGGQFWAMSRFILLGGQLPTQLTCYLPSWDTMSTIEVTVGSFSVFCHSSIRVKRYYDIQQLQQYCVT